MKKSLLLTIPFLIALLIPHDNATAQVGADNDEHLFSPARMDLVIPDQLWSDIRARVGYEGRPLGYSYDEMEHFKGSDCILRNVDILFRDLTSVPQFSGRFSDELLADPANFANATFAAFRTMDAYAARVMEYTLPSGWGVDWIEEGATTDDALSTIIDRPLHIVELNKWHSLSVETQMLILRLIISAREAKPWLTEAFDEDFYKSYFDVEDLSEVTPDQLYEFASAPWSDDAEQPVARESFEALDNFDMDYFATGSNSLMLGVYGAVKQFQLSTSDSEYVFGDFDRFEFDTDMGKVAIFGDNSDIIEGDYFLVVDLGGDDMYSGRIAASNSFNEPIGMVIDLGGSDIYDSGELTASLACGNHGIGAIFDLEGNDVYSTLESGIACAWYGTGLVVDYAGDDRYSGHVWSQGAAHAGVGMLIDLDGTDFYDCDTESQAFGSTFGAGLIIDTVGNDTYFADPEGNISEPFEGRSVSFAQGTGFGRRADFGDGHSLGGGFGILVDGAGDDIYTGSVYSQGAGYWWAIGCLEDRGGNDQYFNEQYSCGSAPHFAIGCLVDLEGNDKYNVGNEDVERQIQGHARDASLAIFIDGSGDDEYFLPNLAAGSSDLNCLTLFWDRFGNDTYTADRNPPSPTAFSFGDSTRYSPFNTFRDDMASTGIFLDTGGIDTYSERDPEDAEAVSALIRIPFTDSTEWIQRDEHPNYGYGLDIAWFEGVEIPEETPM